MDYLLTGHEYLVFDGKVPDKDYFLSVWTKNLVFNKNYRTAVGITNDNRLLLITVDKNSEYKGMSLPELGEYMISKGVNRGINLDGGGSTKMMIRDLGDFDYKVVNLQKESRALANSIMVANRFNGESKVLEVKYCDSDKIHISEQRRLNFKAIDSNLNPLNIYEVENIILKSDVGEFDKDGIFYPVTTPTKGNIVVIIDDIEFIFEINIVE